MRNIRILFIAFSLIAYYNLNAQNISINEDGTVADSSAIVDVKSNTKGFLPPRLTKIELLDIPSPAEGLVVYNTSSKTLNVFNGSDWVDMAGNVVHYELGDYFKGGIIFYLDGNGGGLVCAVTNQCTTAKWGCFPNAIIGADGTAIGTGVQNTIDIEADCATTGIAADICANLSLNGYNDWFLPSKDELNMMYLNKSTIDSAATANGGTSVSNKSFWSSSEYNSTAAWMQHFGGGYQFYLPKNDIMCVIAIRAFTYL